MNTISLTHAQLEAKAYAKVVWRFSTFFIFMLPSCLSRSRECWFQNYKCSMI
jgi:hypothetical protein